MMRRGVPRYRTSALGKNAVTRVAAHLERGNTCDIGGECQHLKIEHEFDMLFPRRRDSGGRRRQLLCPAAGIAFLDFLNTPLDLANVLEVFVHPAAVHGRKVCFQTGGLTRDPIEDAHIRLPPARSFFR